MPGKSKSAAPTTLEVAEEVEFFMEADKGNQQLSFTVAGAATLSLQYVQTNSDGKYKVKEV